MEQKTHERIPKSKLAIQKAFWQLLEEKPLTQIAVKDILERSGVGRTTFYLYYKNKNALLDDLQQNLIQEFMALLTQVRKESIPEIYQKIAGGGYHPIFVEYFRHFREHSQQYLALEKAGVPIQHLLCQAILSLDLSMYAPPNTSPQRTREMASMFVSGYTNVFFIWMRNRMQYSEVQMARILSQYWLNYTYPGIDYSLYNIFAPQLEDEWPAPEEQNKPEK